MHLRLSPWRVAPAAGPPLAEAPHTWTALPSALVPLPAFAFLHSQKPGELSTITSGHCNLQVAITHVKFVYGVLICETVHTSDK